VPEANFVDICRKTLAEAWERVRELSRGDPFPDFLDDSNLIERVRRSINSKTKTYRYVLPTQLVSKLANSELDCRCVQVTRGGRGAFDARTVAHQVVVPFDRDNERVLGGSAEPYVNNPLRIPEVSEKHRGAQKDQQGWDDLCAVLAEVERQSDSEFTSSVFHQVLKEVHARFSQVKVTYPVPHRISLERSLLLIDEFLAVRSRGDRFQAVTAALFLAAGRQFGLFSDLRRGKITAADTAAGMLADIECVEQSGQVVLVVEAKDRELTITQLQDKIPGLRHKRVSEVFFVAAQGLALADADRIRDLIAQQFVSGQNIYVTELVPLARVVLALMKEQGRRRFLELVGEQLDLYSDIDHRRAWATLLTRA
jgi:hypothetical protein